MPKPYVNVVSSLVSLVMGVLLLSTPLASSGHALPPPDDIPEEVLRREIITEARSPIDGQLMTAADYAELQAKLGEQPEDSISLSSGVQNTVFSLRLLKLLRLVNPF